jgi:hypothetical protein
MMSWGLEITADPLPRLAPFYTHPSLAYSSLVDADSIMFDMKDMTGWAENPSERSAGRVTLAGFGPETQGADRVGDGHRQY